MTSVNTERLKTAWRQAAAVCPSRTPRDIYRYVRIDVNDAGSFALHATDGELYVTVGECSEPTFSRLLPVKRFGLILDIATGDEVKMADSTIASGSDSWELSAPDVGDWEFRGIKDTSRQYWVQADEFKTALQVASLSVDVDSTRYALGGVLLDFIDAETLGVVATDGRRLSINQIACECAGEPDVEVLPVVPAKTVKQIIAALNTDGKIAFSFGTTGGIVIDTGDTVICSPLVEGRFPDWRQVVPDGTGKRFDLPSGELATALKSASIVTNEESRGVDCSFTAEGITATASGADVGRSRAKRELLFDAEAEFRCNPEYLLPLLGKVGSDCELCLTYVDSESAIMLTHDGGLTYVLMPLSS